MQPAEIIYRGGKVLILDAGNSEDEAVVVTELDRVSRDHAVMVMHMSGHA